MRWQKWIRNSMRAQRLHGFQAKWKLKRVSPAGLMVKARLPACFGRVSWVSEGNWSMDPASEIRRWREGSLPRQWKGINLLPINTHWYNRKFQQRRTDFSARPCSGDIDSLHLPLGAYAPKKGIFSPALKEVAAKTHGLSEPGSVSLLSNFIWLKHEN